jgi:hypothetical protein
MPSRPVPRCRCMHRVGPSMCPGAQHLSLVSARNDSGINGHDTQRSIDSLGLGGCCGIGCPGGEWGVTKRLSLNRMVLAPWLWSSLLWDRWVRRVVDSIVTCRVATGDDGVHGSAGDPRNGPRELPRQRPRPHRAEGAPDHWRSPVTPGGG